ncbi:MAG: cation-transporting P-type ATPase [Acutalibacteraceae bacterium]|nr:cation-transporting P-type ATPase [Acutalibacteraceae bacterium]
MIFHSSKTEDVLAYFEVDSEKGLLTGVADERLEEHGENIIENTKKTSFKESAISLLCSPINLILIISAILSLIINLTYDKNNWYSPIFIFIMLLINVAIALYSHKQSEKAVQSLKALNSPKIKVLRDGIVKTIDSILVVPGDILILETGDYVAADARLISAVDFRCDEVNITGETISAEKNANCQLSEITPLQQRCNMVYSSSNVLTGHAKAVVTETGMDTEVGKAVTILEASNSSESKLNEKLSAIGRICSIVITVFCAVTFILNLLLNFNSGEKFAVMLVNSFTSAIVLLISVLPDGLPIMAAVAVGYSIKALIKKGLIIKSFSVLDTLPEISVICSDKTGTLTKEKMNLEKIYNGKEIIDAANAYDNPAAVTVLRLASLCTCQSKDDVDTPMYNDATELAIIDSYINNVGSDQQDIFNIYPCLNKLPFDAQRKVTVTVNMIDGHPFAICKGAPDYLIPRCSNTNSEVVNQTVADFANLGMRVIAVTFKQLSEIPSNFDFSNIDDGLNFAGLIALSNPPQNDSVSLVEECINGGVKTLMITGDHAATAKAVAKRLGIIESGSTVMTGEEIEKLTDEELSVAMDNCSVFARLLPDQKLRLVKILKEKGHTVAITGDSVNDAPALSYADVGIAMGSKGTDVARGAANIIMNNSRFSSIINAINTSRGLFCAIRKTITYLFSSNLSELFSILLCLIIFGSFPLAAAPLLFINLVTDSFPIMSILSDGIFEHKPMHVFTKDDKALFTFKSKIIICVQAVVMTAVTVISYSIGYNHSTALAQTMMFTVMLFSQLLNMVSTKFEDFFFKYGHFKNLFVSITLAGFVLISILLIITPLGNALGLTVLTFSQFMTGIAFSLIAFISGELIKLGFQLYENLKK